MIAGLFYWLLWGRPEEKVRARKLTEQRPRKEVVSKEIQWSLISSLIYAFPGAVVIEAWKVGGTALYTDLSWSDLVYIPLSAFIYLFLHDTYFYWTHRWMHKPRIYPVFHKVHHQSRPPTPFAAFSFHPYESLLSAFFLPLLTFVIPLHVGAALSILVLMTICSVINHAGFEIFPDGWVRGPLGRHFITAAHHDLHHKRFDRNYALYFRFWDKAMGTDVFESEYAFLRAGGAEETKSAPRTAAE